MSVRDKARSAKWPSEIVPIEDWDTEVEVRCISGRQRAEFFRLLADDKADAGVAPAHLVIWSTFDPETGQPAFTKDDVDLVRDLPSRPLGELEEAANRVSALFKTAKEEKKGVSSGSPSDGSTSPSPSDSAAPDASS